MRMSKPAAKRFSSQPTSEVNCKFQSNFAKGTEISDLYCLFSCGSSTKGAVFRYASSHVKTGPLHSSRGHLGLAAQGAITGTFAVYITVHGTSQRIHAPPDSGRENLEFARSKLREDAVEEVIEIVR